MHALLPHLVTLAALLPPPAADPRQLHAGIELGGRGVKATVLEAAPGGVYRRVFSRTHNTTLSALDDRGAFRKDAMDDAAAAIAGFYRTFRETYKLPPERIHLVGSSGVPDATNRADFLALVKKATGGKEMRFIDEKTEVALTILGVVPKAERDVALSLDVGGGNTKGGYVLPGKPLVYVAVPLGSVTFTEKARARARSAGERFADAAAALRDKELLGPLRRGARAMPDLPRRRKVYLSGGMVWALVTILHPDKVDDPLVTFTTADFAAFRKRVGRAGGKFPPADLGKIADEGRRLRAAAELKAVAAAYQAENLQAGAEILEALREAFELDGKTLVFPRNAVFGWLAAYVAGERVP